MTILLRTSSILVVVASALVGCVTSGADTNDVTDTGGAPPAHIGSGAQACSGGACVHAGACRPGQASAQFRAQTTPPDDLRPGARAWASVTFDNCSGRTWSAASFALRPHAPADDSTWNLGRIALPADVPDGSGVTIPFEVTAPDEAGTYPFTWAVAGETVGAFEEPSPQVDVAVRYSADCTQPGPPARFQKWTVPSFAATGSKVSATITFANCSVVSWTKADGFALGSQADPDNTTWGEKRVALPMDVPSQSTVTIPLELTAPKTPGSYRFAWKIVQEGKDWFDQGTPVANVTVLEPHDCGPDGPLSRFVREDGVPETVNPDQAIHGSVTFANCSTETWGDKFHVGAANPSNDGVWGAGRIALPLAVAPGYAITVSINGRAPGTGTYPYRWTIVHDGVGPVDEPSPSHTVNVRCLPSCGDHTCGGDGCGGSCGSCDATAACDGSYCKEIPHTLSCSNLQWWNSALTYGPYMSYGWWDTDLAVSSGTRVQLRHDSRLDKHGVYGWGYMPEFTDLVTGHRFRFLHLRPENQYATANGTVYPAGYVVGLSGGDTAETGLGPYSTGAHLCVQTLDPYRTCFPTGRDPCR
jgi:hypothetical protein